MRSGLLLSFIAISYLSYPAAAATGGDCLSVFRSGQPVARQSLGTLITSLRTIEIRIRDADIDFRKPLSAEAVDYIRKAVALPALKPEQATELYNNNLKLLMNRVHSKIEDFMFEGIVQNIAISEVEKITGANPELIRKALKRAIHNTEVEKFTFDEVAAIVELEMSRASAKANSQPSAEIEKRLRPAILFRLQVERDPGCCKTAACNSCPNSFRLKDEIRRETGDSLNAHLKRLADTAPPGELQLFEIQSELKSIVPETNW